MELPSVCPSVRLSVRPGVNSFGRRVNIQQRQSLLLWPLVLWLTQGQTDRRTDGRTPNRFIDRAA